jgi:hypothetical protein
MNNKGEGIIDDIKTQTKKIVKKIDTTFRQRKSNVLPPKVRDFLNTNGKELITTIKVVRTPISSFIKTLMNVISLGSYESAIKKANYDNMFHLSLYINNKYIFDKREIVKLEQGNPIEKDSNVMDISLDRKSITIEELVNKTQSQMGDSKFNRYDARVNNCQDFVLSVLKANELNTSNLESFIKQNADQIFRRMPSITQKIGKFITNTGAVVNKIIEGENINIGGGWKEYVSKEMKGKKFKNREEVNNYMKKISKEYKKL